MRERGTAREGVERGRGRTRLGRPLLVAALLHLLLLLIPLDAGLDRRAPPRRVQIELRAPEPPEPLPELTAPAEPMLPPAPAAPEVAAPAPRSPRPARARPAAAGVTLAPEPAESAAPDELAVAPEPAPPVVERLGPARGDGPIDLLPGPLLARLAGRVEEPAPPGEAARIKKRVHTYVRELQARDRVQIGLIDPYFRTLGETFRASFEPDWSVYDRRSGEKGLGGALRAWLQDYRETADRYALSGSPYREGERDSALMRGGPGAPPDTTLSGARPLGGMGDMAALRDLWSDVVHGRAGGVELLALVRVSQAPDGALLRVEIETPSGRPAYDRLALSSVKTALAEPLRPPRMGEGLGLTGESIESLWAFRTRFTVTPPAWTVAPMAGIGGIGGVQGCDLNANGGVERCFAPLSRQAFPHLELVAVY
ncbi:MAG: hypothetical protein P1V51_00160 [Deltaproteobacteria bacterium]|nr:hypothetical protein [Deltaproteobacteria bacterium]